MNFHERCRIAAQCLPDAPYRTSLEVLHAEMLNEIERLTTPAPVCPVCGSDCNERDELIRAEREIETLRAALADAVEAAEAAHSELQWRTPNERTKMDTEWRVKHESDTHPDCDGGRTYAEWWNVTDGRRTFRADYRDDAEMLAAALNGLHESKADGAVRDANAIKEL